MVTFVKIKTHVSQLDVLARISEVFFNCSLSYSASTRHLAGFFDLL